MGSGLHGGGVRCSGKCSVGASRGSGAVVVGRVTGRGWVLFFFNDTATTEIYTLSLHDALPILVLMLLQNKY